MIKRIFKKGHYYIGDPCYVIENTEWDMLLETTEFFNNENQEFKGFTVAIGPVKNGDGSYKASNNEIYGVDSGHIGIIPIEALNIMEYSCEKFEDDFMVIIDNGTFRFGNIKIKTGLDLESKDYLLTEDNLVYLQLLIDDYAMTYEDYEEITLNVDTIKKFQTEFAENTEYDSFFEFISNKIESNFL